MTRGADAAGRPTAAVGTARAGRRRGCARPARRRPRLDAELLLGQALGVGPDGGARPSRGAGRRRRGGRARGGRRPARARASRSPTSAASRSSTAWPSRVDAAGADPAARRPSCWSTWPSAEVVGRLTVGAAAAGHAAAAGRRRRDRQRARSRSRSRSRSAGGGCCGEVEIAGDRRLARRPRSWPARTPSATASPTRIEFVAADLLPLAMRPPFDVVAGQPAVHPVGRDRRACRSRPRSSRALALDGGPDGLDVIRRLLERLPAASRPDGVGAPGDRRRPGAGGRARGGRAAARLDAAIVHATSPALPRVARIEPAARRPRPSAPRGRPAARTRSTRRARFPIRLVALDLDGTLVGDGPRHPAADRGGDREARGARRQVVARHRPDGRERPAVRRDARPDAPRSSPTRAP